MGEYTAFLDELGLDDLRQVGGKAANLGHLARSGYRVPPGFSVKAGAFDLLLGTGGLKPSIERVLSSLDFADLESVDDAMERVRSMIESAPVPGAVESEVRAACAGLFEGDPDTLVAVRSSVGTRDLSASSFPGQMDTYHNVRGPDEVLELVRRCWASCFSYRAAVSRNARGIDHFDVFIAPLVQQMVPADTAGVLFSANPLNGDPGQVVLNACFGLGEGVVSGEVNADHVVVDRASMRTVEERIGDKAVMYALDESCGRGTRKVPLDASMRGRPCLSAAQVEQLVRLAVEIEDLYGCPQDIEWAYRDGVLYVLQSRRITTLGTARSAAADGEEWDSEFDTRIDPRYPYYTLSNISEVLCGVLTPLTISGIDALDYGFVKTNTDFGLLKDIRPDSEHTFLGIFYNRAHLNLSVVKAVTTKLPGASAQEFERMVPDDAREFEEKFVLTPKSAVTALNALGRVLLRVLRIERDVTSMRRDLSSRIERARRLGVETMQYPDLFSWMDESRSYRFRVIAHHITVSQFAVVFHDLMRKLTGKWLGDESGAIAARLVTGLQNIESAQPSIEIWDLSRAVKESPALASIFARNEPGEIMAALEDGDGDPDVAAFGEALGAFLGRFGYRSVFEAELMLPNWGDDPSYVFVMIQNYLQTDSDASPRELAGKQERERRETSREVMRSLRGPRRYLFSWLLALAQKFIAMREYTKATLIMGIAQIKREYHSLSRRFVAEGITDEHADIFFLTSDEVRALALGRPAGEDHRAVISRRKAEYERNRTVVLPEYSRGKPRPLRADELAGCGDVEVLSGIAVSPGRVTGQARVITDPRSNARIQPGEILIAPVTDAAWTPLFVTAAAIVVDVGGPLSHGSIVAREYGIPGVLNVGTATRMIRTGQVITVDGDTGTVIMHPPESTE